MSEELKEKSPIKPTVSPVKPKPNMVKPSPVKKGANVNPNIVKKNDNVEDNKKKRKIILLIIIIVSSILLIGAGIFFITRIPKSNINFSVEVDSQIVTEVHDPNDGSISKIKYIPGNIIESSLDIEVRNKNGTPLSYEKVFLRFKIDIVVDDNQYSQLFEPIFSKEEHWCKGDDGYYYYYNFCYGDENINVFYHMNFVADRNNNVLNGKSGSLIFHVEILEGEYSAINDNWNTAPREWRETVGSGETF